MTIGLPEGVLGQPEDTRAHATSHLIAKGARLILTEEQIAALHAQGPQTELSGPDNLRLATRVDDLEAAVQTPIPELVRASDNERRLQNNIHAIIYPYSRLFLALVPSADQNKRGWLGHLKPGDRYTGTTISTQTLERKVDGTNISYITAVEYALGDTSNVLVGAVVSLHDRRRITDTEVVRNNTSLFTGQKKSPKSLWGVAGNIADLRLGFEENGSVASVELKNLSRADEKIVQSSAVNKAFAGQRAYNFAVNFSRESTEITIGYGANYRFDIGENKFVKFHKGAWYNEEAPNEISVESFLDVLKEMLTVVPTVKE